MVETKTWYLDGLNKELARGYFNAMVSSLKQAKAEDNKTKLAERYLNQSRALAEYCLALSDPMLYEQLYGQVRPLDVVGVPKFQRLPDSIPEFGITYQMTFYLKYDYDKIMKCIAVF